MNIPTISVVLPRRSQDSAEQAIQAILQCDYPQEQLEILEEIGENPSQQRNRAAMKAKGEILYFLDNDSIATPGLFAQVAQHYQERDDLAGVGGPNLTPETDNFLQKSFGYALASPFAHFKMAARYKSIGRVRETDEKELILCNLSVRRDIFLQENGLNESLYPNEENEFINRLTRKGYRFLYDPDAVVYRSRRTRIRDFLAQFLRYGRGRAEQLEVEGFSWSSLVFLAPLGLLGYLAGCLSISLIIIPPWWIFFPLLIYGLYALISTLRLLFHEQDPWPVLLLPLWSLAMHLAYGTGLIAGITRMVLKKRRR